MRKLKCFQIGGQCVQEVLDEFNERREEFGIPDADIVSVSAMPSTSTSPQAQPDGSTKLPKVEVVIVRRIHALGEKAHHVVDAKLPRAEVGVR